MNFLNEINTISTAFAEIKPVIKLKDLPKDTPHRINSAKVHQGQFGAQILLELEENIVFLPKRVTDAFASHVNQFTPGKFSITFLGLQTFQRVSPRTLFKIEENV